MSVSGLKNCFFVPAELMTCNQIRVSDSSALQDSALSHCGWVLLSQTMLFPFDYLQTPLLLQIFAVDQVSP